MDNNQTNPTTVTQKDPDTAFIIELVGGFFGLLGLGYMYVGRTEEGIMRLLIWLVYDIIAYVVIMILISIFIGCLLIPVQLVIQVAVPIWSASNLKKSMLAAKAVNSPPGDESK